METRIKESFNWMTPEWKVVAEDKRSVKIKGICLPGDIISKNKRKYLHEEIVRAARTLAGKPINVNHDDSRIVGNVLFAEEENGFIEYTGQIKKNPYVRWIKEHDPRIKGVSVQAGYLHLRCVKCNERFYSEEDWKQHMGNTHGIRDGVKEVHGIIFDALSLVVDPEIPGVESTTIELVEMKVGALRLLETVSKTKIEEMDYMKKLKKTAVVSTPKTIAIGKGRKFKEQEENHGCAEDEVWNAEQEKCVKKVAEQEQTVQDQPEQEVKPPLPCADGFEYDPVSGTCIAKEWPEEPTADTPAPLMVPEPTIEPAKVVDPTSVAPAQAAGPIIEQEDGVVPSAPFPAAPPEAPAEVTQECPEGSSWDKISGTCVPDLIPDIISDVVVEQEEPIQADIQSPTDLTKECPVGSHHDPVSGTCVPDAIPAEAAKVIESLPHLLQLGEPKDEHGCEPDEKWDGEKCVAKATEISNNKYIYETMQHSSRKALMRDDKTANAVNTINRATAKIAQETGKTKIGLQRLSIHTTKQRRGLSQSLKKLEASETKERKKLTKKIVEATNKQAVTESKLRAKEDTRIKAKVNDTARKLSRTDMKIARNLSEATKQLNKNDADILKHINALFEKKTKADNKKFSQLATGLAKNLNETRSQKRDYEKIIHVVDRKVLEKDSRIKSLEERIKEQEEECPEGQHKNEEGKCVDNAPPPETEETKKKLTEMATKIENLEAKLKPQFKGQSKPASAKSDVDYKRNEAAESRAAQKKK